MVKLWLEDVKELYTDYTIWPCAFMSATCGEDPQKLKWRSSPRRKFGAGHPVDFSKASIITLP
jgi:hypothetical protein